MALPVIAAVCCGVIILATIYVAFRTTEVQMPMQHINNTRRRQTPSLDSVPFVSTHRRASVTRPEEPSFLLTEGNSIWDLQSEGNRE